MLQIMEKAGAAAPGAGHSTVKRLPEEFGPGKTVGAASTAIKERRADSAFLSAAWRPTVAAPGGQERRCPPYESTGFARDFCALDHIPADGHEVQRAAAHHEQMPDAVPVPKARVVDEEHDAGGVDDAAGQQPGE